eukprot:515998-Amphidinium_carterae.1
MAGARTIYGIDNVGAMMSYIRMSSSVRSIPDILKLALWPNSNPADAPSRGDTASLDPATKVVLDTKKNVIRHTLGTARTRNGEGIMSTNFDQGG